MAGPGEAAANGNGPVAKKTEAEKRKERKQRAKQNKRERWQQQEERQKAAASSSDLKADKEEEDYIIEYVAAPLPELEEQPETTAAAEDQEERPGLGGLGFVKAKADPLASLQDLRKVFEKFSKPEELLGTAPKDDEEDEEAAPRPKESKKPEPEASSSDEEGDDKNKLSKKQLKALNRMKIAELKQVCDRPEVVEVWDVTSQDPALLVFLKAYRNTVPVPRHWSQKRKYLQGKRGIEKPPFKLPDFIEATGITEMRKAYHDKEEAKKLKAKQRDRMAPKMGRMDIDYQKLHDAFFKNQTKPKLTDMGDIYYEGKEFEAHVENIKPGVLSEDLRRALGMSDGGPPPWLINMQRYGPPPSYPNLKVPGLNAPIPPGAQFGYHPGGWGKPPVDEEGNPLYGDVFAQNVGAEDSDDEVDKEVRWGELEPDLEESESEEEDEEEGGVDEQALQDGTASGIASGMVSGMVSGLASGIASSLPSGIETPEASINLRKQAESEQPRQLYQVLEQRQAPATAATLLGTDHVYVIPGTQTAGGTATVGTDAAKKGKSRLPSVLQGLATDVEVTLTPEEVEGLDEAQLKALYDAKVAEARAANRREDFSDLVAAKAAQQKRKAAARAEEKDGKKQKGFKF